MLERQKQLTEAIEFANWAHRGQTRQNKNPYIMHPLHAIILALGHNLNFDADIGIEIMIAIALHNVLEDNPAEVTPEMIEKKFGPEVLRIVQAVTLDPLTLDKRASRIKIQNSDWKIRFVKIADILSNTLCTLNLIKQGGKLLIDMARERIALETEFLGNARAHGDPVPLIILQESAIEAIEEFEDLYRAELRKAQG